VTRPSLFLSAGIGSLYALSDPGRAARVIELAEAAHIDLLCLGDMPPAGRPPAFDALVVASWLAPRAAGVGLIPLVPALASEPFHVARALSALDFLTGGRSGWQPTSGAYDPGRYGTAAGPSGEELLPKAQDFIAATRSLWDSWDADALIIDTATGVYLDPAKVRPAAYRGPFFQVQGPLNAARPPQGWPVLVQSDADPLWRRAAADVLLTDRDSVREAGGPLRAGTIHSGSWSTAVIDEIEGRFRAGHFEGIHITMDDPVTDLGHFTAAALPELRRRGLLSVAARSATLRSRLMLKVPGERR